MAEESSVGYFSGLVTLGAAIVSGVVAFCLGRLRVRSKEKLTSEDRMDKKVERFLDRMETRLKAAEEKADKAEQKAEESERKHEECKVDRERLWTEVAMLKQRRPLP